MRYGPGKFEGCGNFAKVSKYIYANLDEELGESESFGWYGRFSGKIKGRGPFFAVVSENSQGFVDVEWMESEEELEREWSRLQSEYEDFQGP